METYILNLILDVEYCLSLEQLGQVLYFYLRACKKIIGHDDVFLYLLLTIHYEPFKNKVFVWFTICFFIPDHWLIIATLKSSVEDWMNAVIPQIKNSKILFLNSGDWKNSRLLNRMNPFNGGTKSEDQAL